MKPEAVNTKTQGSSKINTGSATDVRERGGRQQRDAS